MHVDLPSGIRIEYESFGNDDAPLILLVMGLGAHMQRWNIEICEGLVARGYRVVRFDNRDAGLSSKADGAPIPSLADVAAAVSEGRPTQVPYTLDDMAADSIALLDALSVDAANVVGISMGGAIAQIMAARYPARVRSLACLMTSSGNPALPWPTPEAAAALFAPLPRDRSREAIVADGIRRYRAVASPAYPMPEQRLQAMFGLEYERCFHPQGVARQLAAIVASGDRRELLASIRVPTLVLHGADDPLIRPACGEDVARHIPGACWQCIDGMGHDLPLALTDRLVGAIADNAARAS